MKKVWLSLLAVCAVMVSTFAYADDIKIGIVDVRQVLQRSPQVTEVQKKLRAEFGKRDEQLQAARLQLQKDSDKLNRDSAVMSAADRTALTQKIQAEDQALRANQANFQRDVYAKQTQEMQTVLNQLQDQISKIARDQKLSLVITKDAIAYTSNAVDITDAVVKGLKGN